MRARIATKSGLPATPGRGAAAAWIVAGGLLLALAIAGAAGLALWAMRDRVLREAAREAGNIAFVLADHTDRSLQAVELALLSVLDRARAAGALQDGDALAGWAGTFASHETMLGLTDTLPQLNGILLIGADGKVVGGSRSWPPLVTDNSDREYFRAILGGADRHVGVPIHSRANGAWMVPVARRIEDARGGFLGVAMAAVAVDYLSGLYHRVALGRASSIVLFREDGVLLAREPHIDQMLGVDHGRMPVFTATVATGPARAVRVASLDGVERLFAGHAVPSLPLRVHVGLSTETVLEPVRAAATRAGIGVALLLALLGAVVWAVLRLFRAQAQAARQTLALQAEIVARQADFRLAVENMSQAIWRFGPDGRLVLANGRCEDVMGCPNAAARPGATLEEVIAAASRAGARGAADVIRRLARQVEAAEHSSFLHDLPDGRTTSVAWRRMSDGGWLVTFEDVTERHAAEARMRFLARHDALTGLPNRLEFAEQLAAALQACAASAAPPGMAVLYLDLDRFKMVNDTLGHAAGDALLHAAAARIAASVRTRRHGPDLVARLGGDEFAILLRTMRSHSQELRADAAAVAARLVAALSEPFELQGHQVVVGATVGVAVFPDDGTSPAELLRTADLALYRAKADGRGRHLFFDRAMDEEAQARRAVEADLRRSLFERDGGDFEIHFQPVVDIATRRPTACEALLRWRRPGHDRLSPPAEFIPIAEETNLILPLGELALRRACAEAAAWQDRSLRLAVNLSPAQFRRDGLVAMVSAALDASGLEPERLEIEVTESLLLERTAEALATMHELRALGVRFAMDDFGTGYSSLSYLRSFPFDRLKIDRSFVRDIEGRPEDAAIVRSVVAMCADLGMSTVAEGIETEGQLAILGALRCREGQGYLFGRPQPPADLRTLLARLSGSVPPASPVPLRVAS
jgi:diguanylate cyclase (GGDEF)-like protein